MQSAVRVAATTLTKRSPLLMQTRNRWVVSPPMNRVSFAEKLVHGFIISTAIAVPPGYILSHLDHYKGIA